MWLNRRTSGFVICVMWVWASVGQTMVVEPNLPTGFPEITVTKTGEPAPGVFIGTVSQGFTTFYVILDNAGYPLYCSKTQPLSSFVQPNGLVAIPILGVVNLKDETLTRVDSFAMTPGYTIDSHDFKLLTNGHALVMGKEVRSIDMSRVVAGGRPDALVTGNVVQEIDADKHVVFEWHTFDEIPITDSFYDLTQKNIDYAHINSVSLDPLDNHLLVSLRTTSEIVKVSRSTGKVIWRLGGKGNRFTLIGEHEENAPYYTVGQHDVSRLPNGNLLFFDNGNISGGGPNPCDRNYSRVVEYHLDEVGMTATLVWEYRHDPDISSLCTGSAKRLDNGNTLIEWGCAIAKSQTMITEVSALGEVVLEMAFAQAGPSASLTKQVWNRTDIVQWQTYPNIKAGQACNAVQIGVSATVDRFTGNRDYNGLVIRKIAEAARFPRFIGKEPQLLVHRVTLAGYGMTEARLGVTFDAKGLEFNEPAQLTVYHRPDVGQGEFTALATTAKADGSLSVADAQLGEFVFGYPDAPDKVLPPALGSPEDLGKVNQTQPVVLQWTARGFGRSYQVQVATDAQFATLVADESGWTGTRYTLSALNPATTYYWRVRTVNYAGPSDWASQSFNTVPSTVQVVSPNGGEQWKRGLKFFIQWQDNLTEAVVVEIHKGGKLLQTVAKVTSDPAIQWEIPLNLAAGDDYTIRVKSATTEAVADVSDGPFTIN